MYNHPNSDQWVDSWIQEITKKSLREIFALNYSLYFPKGYWEACDLCIKYYVKLPSLTSIPPSLQKESDTLYKKLKRDDGYYEKCIEKPEFIQARMGASTTLQGRKFSTKKTTSSTVPNFYDCILMVSKMARGACEQHDTVDRNFINDINFHLRQNLSKVEDRARYGLRLDDLRYEVLKAQDQGQYIPQQLVASEFDNFITWLNEELTQCDNRTKNPIIVAAIAYQRFISIHPYADGNGRTGRMLMDYILQRYGLPPACFDKQTVGNFIGNRQASSNATKAVEAIIAGLNTTTKLIPTKPSRFNYFKESRDQQPHSQDKDKNEGPALK